MIRPQGGHAILNTMRLEHQAILKGLETFQTGLGLFGRDVFSGAPRGEDFDVFLRRVIVLCREEIRPHSRFEEEVLYPFFAKRVDPGVSLVLERDHQMMHGLSEHVAELAERGRDEGFDPLSWADFHAQGLSLAEHEIFHIQKEETTLLPALERLLDASADHVLMEAHVRLHLEECGADALRDKPRE